MFPAAEQSSLYNLSHSKSETKTESLAQSDFLHDETAYQLRITA